MFSISILGEHEPYEFPEKQELQLRLKDILETNVDEKYYLSQEQVDRITFSTYNTGKTRIQEKDWCDTLCARDFKDPKCVKVNQIGQYDTPTRKNSNRYRVYDAENISPSLTTMGGGNLEPHIPIKNATIQTLDVGDNKGVVIGASRGRNPKNPSDRTVGSPTEQRLEINKQGTSNTITTVQKDNYVVEPLGTLAAHNSDKFGTGYMDGVSKTLKANKHDISVVYSSLRIRKLTPLECWRLMGFTDDEFHEAEKVNSNTQLYKQAGNSIVVNVLEEILYNLLLEDYKYKDVQLNIMDYKGDGGLNNE